MRWPHHAFFVDRRTVIFGLVLTCGVLLPSLMPVRADGVHPSRGLSRLLSEVAENNETTYLELQSSCADGKPTQIEEKNIRGWQTAGYQEACRDPFVGPATLSRTCPPSAGLGQQAASIPLILIFISFERNVSARNLYVTLTAANEPECATKWFDGSFAVLVCHGDMAGVRMQVRTAAQ